MRARTVAVTPLNALRTVRITTYLPLVSNNACSCCPGTSTDLVESHGSPTYSEACQITISFRGQLDTNSDIWPSYHWGASLIDQ